MTAPFPDGGGDTRLSNGGSLRRPLLHGRRRGFAAADIDVLSRLGVAVTLLETADRVLPAEEPEVGRLVAATLRSEGVDLRENVDIEKAGSSPTGVELRTAQGVVRADRLLIATGRRKMLSSLGLDSIGVDSSADGVDVDECLRAAPGVWAMDDRGGTRRRDRGRRRDGRP